MTKTAVYHHNDTNHNMNEYMLSHLVLYSVLVKLAKSKIVGFDTRPAKKKTSVLQNLHQS